MDAEYVKRQLLEGIEIKRAAARDCAPDVAKAAETIAKALGAGNKLLVCGNGGSAADSQHIAAELVGRFEMERRALPAIALSTDTSILTAVSNDYSFEKVFARQVEAHGTKGDVLFAISTSGNSGNVLEAVAAGRKRGMRIISMTGISGGKLRALSDICIKVPSDKTPRIQEVHIAIGHIICELVEKELFGK